LSARIPSFLLRTKKGWILCRAGAAGELTPHLYKLHPGGHLALPKNFQGDASRRFEKRKNESSFASPGDGLAPFVSYVRTLLQGLDSGKFADAGESQAFLHSGRKPQLGIRLSRRNGKFAAEVPWFKYVSTISRPWEDENGPGKRDAWMILCGSMLRNGD